ncbi:hypothetical protein STCU_07972 [Strigomonas culicis]|uniref:Uncharacterized protein n=1 Tax=Strigomonas culicis TaxID=28005 RepID=S9TWW4_9TRYP|nr:hypothetical protein STCU_07972 [Strigomonas culicis]|eukprot:EPY22987.1 hypothetical protein STCU_07972 [Strigomonas culicis]
MRVRRHRAAPARRVDRRAAQRVVAVADAAHKRVVDGGAGGRRPHAFQPGQAVRRRVVGLRTVEAIVRGVDVGIELADGPDVLNREVAPRAGLRAGGGAVPLAWPVEGEVARVDVRQLHEHLAVVVRVLPQAECKGLLVDLRVLPRPAAHVAAVQVEGRRDAEHRGQRGVAVARPPLRRGGARAGVAAGLLRAHLLLRDVLDEVDAAEREADADDGRLSRHGDAKVPQQRGVAARRRHGLRGRRREEVAVQDVPDVVRVGRAEQPRHLQRLAAHAAPVERAHHVVLPGRHPREVKQIVRRRAVQQPGEDEEHATDVAVHRHRRVRRVDDALEPWREQKVQVQLLPVGALHRLPLVHLRVVVRLGRRRVRVRLAVAAGGCHVVRRGVVRPEPAKDCLQVSIVQWELIPLRVEVRHPIRGRRAAVEAEAAPRRRVCFARHDEDLALLMEEVVPCKIIALVGALPEAPQKLGQFQNKEGNRPRDPIQKDVTEHVFGRERHALEESGWCHVCAPVYAFTQSVSCVMYRLCFSLSLSQL